MIDPYVPSILYTDYYSPTYTVAMWKRDLDEQLRRIAREVMAELKEREENERRTLYDSFH